MSYAISTEGLALIQEHEGFRSRPAPLPDGGWVVGYGHVRTDGPGKRVTRQQATALLMQDLAPVEAVVKAKVRQPLTQSQFDALASFAFSIGVDAFARSQVVRQLNRGDFVLAACAMEAWRKSETSGEVSAALLRRRAAEKSLFLKDLPQETAPSAMLRAKLDRAALAPASARKPRDPGQRITEILMSEPATKAVLMSEPVVAQPEPVEEIVTAHAKPVARKTQPPQQEQSRAASDERTESFGLFVLLGIGLALISIGATLLFEGGGRLIEVIAATALAAPGVAISLTAAFALRRGPQPQYEQQLA